VGRTSGPIISESWSSARQADTSDVRNRTLTGRVQLDGRSFDGCRFEQAVLVYSGGPLPRIANCVFDRATFAFEGPAGRSMALLQAMSAPSSGLRDIFKASFPKIFGH
jgi:hypothetical protein